MSTPSPTTTHSSQQTPGSAFSKIERDIQLAEKLLSRNVFTRGLQAARNQPSRIPRRIDRRSQTKTTHSNKPADTPVHQEPWRQATEDAVRSALHAALGTPPQGINETSKTDMKALSTVSTVSSSSTHPSISSTRHLSQSDTHIASTHTPMTNTTSKSYDTNNKSTSTPQNRYSIDNHTTPMSYHHGTENTQERDEIVRQLLWSHERKQRSSSASDSHGARSVQIDHKNISEEIGSGTHSNRRHHSTDREVPYMESTGYQSVRVFDSDSEDDISAEIARSDPKSNTKQTCSDRSNTTKKKSFFRRKTKEELQQEAAKKFAEKHPFRPSVRQQNSTRTQPYQTTERPTWERFEEYEQAKEARLAKLREEKEREEAEQCTFRPSTNSDRQSKLNNTASTDRRNSRNSNFSRDSLSKCDTVKSSSDRLYRQAKQRQEKLDELRKKREAEEKAQLLFRPKVNPDSLAMAENEGWKPIHERISDIQRAKNAHLQMQRLIKYHADPDLTYQPSIERKNVITKDILPENEIPAKNVPVAQRLIMAGQEREQRQQMRKLQYEAELKRNYTFKPQIDRTSTELLEQDPDLRDVDFLHRQEMFMKQKEERQRAYEQALREKEKQMYTYKPKTGNADQILSYSRPERISEPSYNAYERLSSGDAGQREAARKAIEQEYYKDFTFQPQINPISKLVGRKHTIQDLASLQEKDKSLQKLKAQAEAEFEAQHSFTPQLMTNPDAVLATSNDNSTFRLKVQSSPHTISTRIRQWQEQRDAKLQQARLQSEQQQLQGCTFEPEKYAKRPPPPAAAGPVVVRGLGRHLELRELASRQEDEQRRRYEQAFAEKARYRDVSHTTEPIPFSFTLDDPERQKRKEARMKALQKQIEENCGVQENCSSRRAKIEAFMA